MKKKVLRKVNDLNSLLGCKLDPLSDFKTGQFGPTTKDVLRKYKFHLEFTKKGSIAINKTASALIKVWKPARIPLLTKVNIVKKVKGLAKKYRQFKNYKKETESLIKFRDSLKQRFMIAAEHAETLISNDPDLLPKDKEEDLKFLKLLRDSQVVSLGPVDRKLLKRLSKKKAKSFKPQESDTLAPTFSNDTLSSSTIANSDTTPEELYIPPTASKANDAVINLTMKRDNWINAIIPHADRHKLSPAGIFAFCAATVQAGGCNLQDISLSLSTIRRLKMKAETETAGEIKENFVFPQHLVAHFDGKRRKQHGEWNDFLAVCVTGKGLEKEKFLGDIPIEKGTGKLIAENVYKLLSEWNIDWQVISLSFDTTSCNTGSINGANVNLEVLLDKPLLWLACFHHIMELIMIAAVRRKLGPTCGPNDSFFPNLSNFLTS